MKELIIYFGKKDKGLIGFGEIADTIKCTIQDELTTIYDLTQKKWVEIGLSNGKKYINTDNILWFDIVENNETKGE